MSICFFVILLCCIDAICLPDTRRGGCSRLRQICNLTQKNDTELPSGIH